MNPKTYLHKSSFHNATKNGKRERSFELSLPTLVSGTDALGSEFEEFTEIISISSQEAIFGLDSKVLIGSKLNMSLNIPKTLFLENTLKLEVAGNVRYVKADQNGKKNQLIILRLDKSYKIKSFPRRKI